MPEYSQASLSRLETCHSDLHAILEVVISCHDHSILCGHRDEEAQEAAFAAGNSKARWDESHHNLVPSMAVDIAPYPIDWDDLGAFYILAGYVLRVADELYEKGMITHKVRFGGDWDGDKQTADQTFNDLGHFELYVPITLP